MKKNYFIFLFLFLCLASFAQQLKPVAQKINERKSQHLKFSPASLFNNSPVSSELRTQLLQTFSDATVLELRPSGLQHILAEKPENLFLTIPSGNGADLKLELYRAQLFTPDFSVTTASGGSALPYSEGLHYQGIIKG